MHWTDVLETLWIALNSPVGITAVASVVLYLLNKLYAAKPGWARFEGAIISAVKFAEKEIPDDTPNKSLERLDTALRYAVKVFAEVKGRAPTTKEKAELKEGVQVTHAALEAEGVL